MFDFDAEADDELAFKKGDIITFVKNDEDKEWMWGKWQIENNILEIKSEHHYHWQFKIISIEKIKFKYENKNYSTIKLIAIKKKFINQD